MANAILFFSPEKGIASGILYSCHFAAYCLTIQFLPGTLLVHTETGKFL